MSRIDKKSIIVPKDVKVELDKDNITVKGAKGELSRPLSEDIAVELKDGQIKVRGDFQRKLIREQAGLTLALINNMIKGVTGGYAKELEIVGVGFRAQVQADKLNLQLGFSHPVVFSIPKGIKIQVPKQTQIIIEGIDKQAVGNVAAQIRAISRPEPYKGKGIRYKGEYVRRKLGKAVTK
jgi:large subunit ribosomal protein L6